MSDQNRAWQRPSIYDVAAHAGVSHMTVSRVLNGHPNIRDSTRERVMQAIDEMNYTRSSIARALATRKAMRIGVMVDGPVEYGPNSTLRALERAARDSGYSVSAFSISDDPDLGVDVGVADLMSQGVDALCVIAPRSSSLDTLREQPIRVPVLVVKADPDPEMMTVAVDQRAGAHAAVAHLVDLGHREILHISGPLDWLDARARHTAWEEDLSDRGLTIRDALVGDWTSDAGFAIGRDAPAIDDVTAVFASNDQMALGLIHGLTKRGLRVPEDISVVGFDDLPDARHFLPPLTTVRQDFAELGRLGLELLVSRIAGEEPADSAMILPELIVRESTAPPRA